MQDAPGASVDAAAGGAAAGEGAGGEDYDVDMKDAQ